MGEDLHEQTEQDAKQKRKPFFQLADDELMITHVSEPHIHRVIFRSKHEKNKIPVKSSLFNKLRSKIQNWNDNNPLNFWKNNCYTLGLSKHGKIIIYVKSDLKVFPKEFLRSLKQDFNFTELEIRVLIEKLDFVDLEISHKINDPNGKIGIIHGKKAKIEYKSDELIKKLIAFTDESHGSLELEFRGDPALCSNLEFLLRDKLNAILYFAELTKIVHVLTGIQEELRESIQYVSNAITFLIDDLLNKRISITKQKGELKNSSTDSYKK